MSRVGKNPVIIPAGVTCEVNSSSVKVSGPKGSIEKSFNAVVTFIIEENDGVKSIRVQAQEESRFARMMTGTARSIVQGMVNGVLELYRKDLLIEGVGFKADLKGDVLNLSLGFSHGITYKVPASVSVRLEGSTTIIVEGVDKHMVGQVAASIKHYRPAEPYKGKGVRIRGEYVIRKEGKKGAK